MIVTFPPDLTSDLCSLQKEWVFPRDDLPEEETWNLLKAYVFLLYRWSERMNLISKNERPLIVKKHIWRALAMLPLIRSVAHGTIMDVGSGSGLPAIPLKICLPDSKFYLVESRRRRANFLKEVVRRLELKNIEVINDRVENWLTVEVNVDVVTARSVSNPTEILTWIKDFLGPSGHLVCTLKKNGEDFPDSTVERFEWMEQVMRVGRFPTS